MTRKKDRNFVDFVTCKITEIDKKARNPLATVTVIDGKYAGKEASVFVTNIEPLRRKIKIGDIISGNLCKKKRGRLHFCVKIPEFKIQPPTDTFPASVSA